MSLPHSGDIIIHQTEPLKVEPVLTTPLVPNAPDKAEAKEGTRR